MTKEKIITSPDSVFKKNYPRVCKFLDDIQNELSPEEIEVLIGELQAGVV